MERPSVPRAFSSQSATVFLFLLRVVIDKIHSIRKINRSIDFFTVFILIFLKLHTKYFILGLIDKHNKHVQFKIYLSKTNLNKGLYDIIHVLSFN